MDMGYKETLQNYNQRLNKIASDINSLPESQEHSVSITENGNTVIIPEGNHRFSKVTVNTNVIPDNSTSDLSGQGFSVISIKELDKTSTGAVKFSSGYEHMPFSPRAFKTLPEAMTIEATIDVPMHRDGMDQYWGNIIAWNDSLNKHDGLFIDLRRPPSTGAEPEVRFLCTLRQDSSYNIESVVRFVNALSGYQDKQVHIALVLDPNAADSNFAKLYVNGVLFQGETDIYDYYSTKQNMSFVKSTYQSVTPTTLPLMTIGGDWREKNPSSQFAVHHVDNWRYFRGGIYNVALFSDARTQAEIQSDMAELPVNGADNLMLSYDFTGSASVASAGLSLRPGYSLRPVAEENKLASLIDRTISNVTREDFQDVAVISKYAFAGCNNLGYCEIPDNVVEIEGNAFLDCSSLEYIDFYTYDPPVIYENSFSGIPDTCVFRAYKNFLDIYKTMDIWRDIKNPFEIIEEID